MGLFQTRRPRGFHHTYIYYGRSSSRRAAPGREAGDKERLFRERWHRRTPSRRNPLLVRLVLLALLAGLLYYLLNGSQTIL